MTSNVEEEVIWQGEQLTLDRVVRSATAGSAGEASCSHILEAIGLIDGSSWSIEQLEALWEDASAPTIRWRSSSTDTG